MVKAVVLLENLKNAVVFANHGISSRSTLPILLNLLIEAKDGNLCVSSTDLEIGIKIKIPAKIEEEGQTTVPAKTFVDLISSLNIEKIELLEKGSTLELRGEKIKTSFPTISAAEFPKLYEEKGQKQASFLIDGFIKDVSRVVFSAASDIGRPALSGVFIRKEEKGGQTIVATDGYRLSLKEDAAVEKSKEGANTLLIPARIIREVLGIRQRGGSIDLFTFETNNQALFEYEDTTIVGRLIEAEYPNYQKIIPDDFSTRAFFNRQEAQNAVRICSVFAREAANIVRMTIGSSKIRFSTNASSVGENEVEIEAKTEGEENEIAFNARYLLDLFSNIDEEDMIFEMSGPLNPGVFKLEKDKKYLHLIMPIRIAD